MKISLSRWALLIVIVAVSVTRLLDAMDAIDRNRTALACATITVSNGYADAERRCLTPIHAVLLYVPRAAREDLASETLLQWAQKLATDDLEYWDAIVNRSPAYTLEAWTTEWSLLGYDVLDDGHVVRLYWQSHAVYTKPPVFAAGEDQHTLAVGQRLYQDVFLAQGSTRDVDDAMRSAPCPACTSALEYLAGSIGNLGPSYVVPAFLGDRFCFFGVILSAADGVDLGYTDTVIVETPNGAWTLVAKKTPPLVDPLPRWDLALPGSGWQSANAQTTVEPSSDGLIVTASDNDPAIVSPAIRIDAHQARRVLVRARATRGNTIRLFWTTLDQPYFDEPLSSAQRLYADGKWHTYEFALSGMAGWQGVITRLRLDPTTRPGIVDIAEILVR